jgi:hypothetical protein
MIPLHRRPRNRLTADAELLLLPQQRNHSILVEMDRSNKRLSVVAARVAG